MRNIIVVYVEILIEVFAVSFVLERNFLFYFIFVLLHDAMIVLWRSVIQNFA